MYFNVCNNVAINHKYCVIFPNNLLTLHSLCMKNCQVTLWFYQEPNGLGSWTYATDFHGNKCGGGGICNHVSCSANRQFFSLVASMLCFPTKKTPLNQTKPACQIYSGGQETVLTWPCLYQTGNKQGRARWYNSDVNPAGDHAGPIQVKLF